MSCDLEVINDYARCWEENFQLYYNTPFLPQNILDKHCFRLLPEDGTILSKTKCKQVLCKISFVCVFEGKGWTRYGQYKSGELVISIILLYSG